MLQVTKKFEYGLIALLYMGAEPGRAVSAREIAQRNLIPTALTANVLKALAKGNLIATRRGVAGGYALERSLGDITIGDVVTALEGPAGLTQCCQDPERKNCELVATCSIRSSILQLNERLFGWMRAMSVEEFGKMGDGARN
jgi:Rrf2 family protein